MIQLLRHEQVLRKINRLAIQILEQHYTAPELVLVGVNQNGYRFAQRLSEALARYAGTPRPVLGRVSLQPAHPTNGPIELSVAPSQLTGKPLILVDDVANTGRTLYYAVKPLLEVLPQSVQVAVMVERKHQQFPIQIDFVGLQLATTFEEHVEVRLEDTENMAVYLH